MRCEPADTIIKKFNGLTAVSEIVGVTPHSVMRWRKPREDGGTGGIVPHWHMERLLEAAKDKGIKLAPSDFLPDFSPASSPKPEKVA